MGRTAGHTDSPGGGERGTKVQQLLGTVGGVRSACATPCALDPTKELQCHDYHCHIHNSNMLA